MPVTHPSEPSQESAFVPVVCSLEHMIGEEHARAICRAQSALGGQKESDVRGLAAREVEFWPAALESRLLQLLPKVGERVIEPLVGSPVGATTSKWAAATNLSAAPLAGLGYYRIGEDGRLSLITKAEHYHASLGHGFPGYRLIEHAKALAIPNATHNNTRGAITRLLEEELVRTANGIDPGDTAALDAIRSAERPGVINRVLNLETGSLAGEAAIKLVLHRFHAVQADSPAPKYAGRVPVLLVVGDESGALTANYHGTTIFAQAMRGMWSTLSAELERSEWMLVRGVRLNDVQHLDELFATFEAGKYKVAGFFHELILMNYGGKVLSRPFIQRAYELCDRHDVPAVVDEIQTGAWSPELLMVREYGVRPSCVALGKGFPGGEYPASRLLFSADLDTLPQFGALVTNGQEELASLAYLITMRWVRANAEPIQRIGDYFEQRMRDLVQRRRGLLQEFHGCRHMGGLHFDEVAGAKRFAARLNQLGLDISVQSYKTSVPPAAMIKLPLIANRAVVDCVVGKMEQALDELG